MKEKGKSIHTRNVKRGGRPRKKLKETTTRYGVILTKSQEEQFKRITGSNGIETMRGFLRQGRVM